MFVVIGGSSRTGTTLVSEFLSNDQNATSYLPECVPLQILLAAYDDTRTSNNRKVFFSAAEGREFYSQTVQRFMDQIPVDRRTGQALVLKCPTMTPYFGTLDELISGGRYLLMIRDPRDILTSQIKVARRQRARGRTPSNALHASENVVQMSMEVLRCYERILREGAAQLVDRMMVLRYEDLTQDPEGSVSRLRDFTGLELTHSPEEAGQVDRGGGHRTELSGGPFSDANVGSYGRVLTSEQIQAVEKICGPFLRLFGYEDGSSPDRRSFSASINASSIFEKRIGGLEMG